MKIPDDFRARLPFEGEVEPIINEIVSAYGFQEVRRYKIVSSGFEDCNFVVETEQKKIFLKIYSRIRTMEDIKRNILILEAVAKSTINHPRLHLTENRKIQFAKGSINAIAMDYIDGESFHDLDRKPSDKELKLILKEAIKIGKLSLRPTFIYDTIAIVNLLDMYKRVVQHLSPEDIDLLQPVIREFKTIDFDNLPKGFVHGDLISTNLILDTKGEVWIIDFSVANIYPRVQEIAVIASSLLYKDKQSLKPRTERLISYYEDEGGSLNALERNTLYPMSLAAQAMELMGGYQYIHINKDNIEEARHWQEVGRQGLQRELKE